MTRRPASAVGPWLARLALCLVAVCTLLSGTLVASTLEHVQHLTQGQARLALTGQAPRDTIITLPLHWDILLPGQSGRVEVQLAFDCPPGTLEEPWLLLIPRLGNAWRIAVNGTVLQQGGTLQTIDDAWAAKRPAAIQIPALVLRERNSLTISLRADIGRRAGLSTVSIGPTREMQQQWNWLEWTRVTLPQAASVLSLLVAGFCMLLWWQLREPLYAAAAVGETAWALRLTDTWWEASLLPWPWWGLVALALFWIWGGAIYLMADAVWEGQRPRTERRVVLSLILTGPLFFLLAWALQSSWPSVAWMVASMLVWWGLLLRLGAMRGQRPHGPGG